MLIVPQLITPPARAPIDVDVAKAQINVVDEAMWDDRISALIGAATSYAENYTGRALITRTYHGFLDHWPRLGLGNGPAQDYGLPGPFPNQSTWLTRRYVEIPRPPLQSIAFVKTYNDEDEATLMDAATYFVDSSQTVGRLVRRRHVEWPRVWRVAAGIEIQWTCGYGVAPSDIPDPIRHALLLLISHWFEHREAVVGVEGRDSSTPIPLGVADLLAPYKVAYFD